jgi:hypothetical protein
MRRPLKTEGTTHPDYIYTVILNSRISVRSGTGPYIAGWFNGLNEHNGLNGQSGRNGQRTTG